MKIIFRPEIMLKIMSFANAVAPQEFSGFGFVNRVGKDLDVYDFVILNVGSTGYTEIPEKKILALMDRPDSDKMHLWGHRHPIEGWSGRDMQTILTEPLGGIPEMVKWSASVVLTPSGWIGRVDNYIKKTFVECQVLPDLKEIYDLRRMLLKKDTKKFNPTFDNADYSEERIAIQKTHAAVLLAVFDKFGEIYDNLDETRSHLAAILDDLDMTKEDLENLIYEMADEEDVKETAIDGFAPRNQEAPEWTTLGTWISILPEGSQSH